jgi:long-subunit fatty acid transport protein
VRARHSIVPATLALLALVQSAHAGGLDIPTLYTARHAGMGGTAIASVDDASAVHHNPAGLGQVDGASAIANLSLFITNQQTSPDYPDQNIQSGYRLGPAPFLAGAIRVHEIVAVGLGAYPLGAVGGRFEYENSFGNPTLNEQTALAFEVTPAIAIAPIEQLRFGVGHRVTFLHFQRRLGPASDPSTVDVDTFGANFAGFRFGAQWQLDEHFELGAAYRHQVRLSATADRGRLLGQEVTDIEGTLTVPAKLGFGARVNLESVSVAADYELVRNSQFDELEVSGRLPAQGSELSVPFVFNWSDSSTVKFGAELRIVRLRARAGYAWDDTFVNPAYPSTFSSPPDDAHYFTIGGGYDAGGWQANVAWSQRLTQSEYIEEQEIASKGECPFCGSSGNYVTSLAAGFVDVSVNFEEAGVRNPYKKKEVAR